MTERQTLYWLTGSGSYWVIQRAGYDIAAFSTEAEARAVYDKMVAAERAADGENEIDS